MVQRDAILAAAALMFGALATNESSKLTFGTIHSPGPGFFPWWTSVIIVLLALVLMIQALRSRSSTARSSARIAKVVLLLIVLAAYTLLLDLTGYLFSTFFLVLFMLRALDPQRWKVALSMAALTAVGSYVVFAIWLSIPLPRGPF